MKSILFRLSARLCIATLLFQSLWPTVVLATQAEVLQPLAAPSTLPIQSEPPQYNLETFITDDMGREPPKTARVSFPILETRQETQAYIDGASDIQSLYKNLHITGEGLEWSSYGFDFLMHYTGHLLVTRQAQAPQPKALGIYHNMDVWLGDGINLDVMRVQGRHIVHRGKESHIGRLELKALGTKKTPGWIFNGDTASLVVKEMYVLEGQVKNQGDLFLAAGGKLDMGGKSCLNEKLLNLGKGSVVENVDILKNTGTVEGIGGEIRGNQLDNQAQIATDTLKVTTTLAFNNAKDITTKVSADLTSLGSFSNAGTLASDGALKTNVKEGTNTGTISSRGTLDAVFTGTFHNKGSFISQGASRVTVTGLLLNERGGLFKSHSALAFLGGGEVLNSGTISAMGLLSLENRLFMNEGLLCADGDFRFALAERFANSGSLVVKGQTIISGKGEIVNEAAQKDTDGLGFEGDVVFDNYQGRVVNKGLFNGEKSISGTISNLENSGTFGANRGFNNLTITDFSNTGSILGDGILLVHRGKNRHLIQSKKLKLSIGETFTNLGTMTVSDAFVTLGSGEFIQKGILEGARIAIDNARFENQVVAWIQKNAVLTFGEHVTYWKNAEGSSLDVQTIGFLRGVQPSTILNEGTLMSIRFVNESQVFRNRGKINVDQLEQSGVKVINEFGGELKVHKSTVLAADTIENAGEITFEGPVTGSLTHAINKGGWTFKGKTTLWGDDFVNEKLLRAEALFDWAGKTFDNRGKALIFDNHIAPTRQFINRNLFFWTRGVPRGNHIYNAGTMARLSITDKLAAEAKPYVRVTTENPEYKRLTMENLGKLIMKGITTSGFEAWINTGVLSLRSMSIKAKTFENQGVLETSGNCRFEGKTFTSGDKSHLQAGNVLTLATQDPLLLQGVVQGDKGVTLRSAVSVENKAELHNPTGQMLIDTPQIINRRLINADTFVYEGKSLLNYDTFEANAYKRASPFETVLNEKTMIVRKGGFTATHLTNHGTVKKDPKDDKKYLSRGLQLHEGNYVVEFWDNFGGEADIDRFAISFGEFVLAGKLHVNQWLTTSSPYDVVRVIGDVTIAKAVFQSKKLENTGNLLLGEGMYRFDLFENKRDPSEQGGNLWLSPKTEVFAHEFLNAGLVDADDNLYVILEGARVDRRPFEFGSGAQIHIDQLLYGFGFDEKRTSRPFIFTDKWQAGKDLILDLPDDLNPITFLLDDSRFLCERNLHVRAKTWDTREHITMGPFDIGIPSLKISTPLILDVANFIYTGTFTFKGLTLTTQTFSAQIYKGSEGPSPSILDVYGPLDITVAGDLDNREGVIRSLGKTKMSALGRILNGATRPRSGSSFGGIYQSNGALISCSDELTMNAKDIITDFGQIYSKGTLSLTAGGRISVKSTSVSGSGDIKITARSLDVLVGDVYEGPLTLIPGGYSERCPRRFNNSIVDGASVTGTFYSQIKQCFTSGAAAISAPGGSIWINADALLVKGSQILSNHKVYLSKSGSPYSETLPRGFQIIPVSAPVIAVSSTGQRVIDHGGGITNQAPLMAAAAIRGGERVEAVTGDGIFISGSINAPVVTMRAKDLLVQGFSHDKRSSPLLEGNLICNLREVLEHIMGVVPVIQDASGTKKINQLGAPDPLPFDPSKLPLAKSGEASIPHPLSSAVDQVIQRVIMDPELLKFTVMYALSDYCGTLNVFGKSGVELMVELYKKGKKKEADAGKQGQILTRDHLSTFTEGMLFNMVESQPGFGNCLVPHLLLTPEMAQAHARESGSITGGKIDAHTTGSTTLQRAVISGRDDVSVTSEGTITILRDKKVVERQIPGGTSRQEFSDPAVLIECTQGSTKVVAKKDLTSVASDLRAAKDLEAGSTEGHATFTSQKRSSDTHREEDTRFGHETHKQHSEEADQQKLTAGGTITRRAGPGKTVTSTAAQVTAGKDIKTEGGKLVEESMPLRQSTTDTYEKGGRTSRSGGSHTETVEVLRAVELAGGDIDLNTQTAEFRGAILKWGLTDPKGTLHDRTARSKFGPLEFDTHDEAWAQRRSKGWGGFGKKSAGSHTSRDEHHVIPTEMSGPNLDLAGPAGAPKGETEFCSAIMDIKGETFVGKHVRETTVARRSRVEESSFAKNGLGLSLPKLPSTSFKEHGALDRYSHGIEATLPYLQAVNQALAYANGKLSVEEILAHQFGTLTWGQSRFHSVLDQVADVPNLIHWGARAKFADDTMLHLKGYNRVGAVEGKLRRLSAEPLRSTTRYESASQSSTTSVNPFTTQVGYSEQKQHQVGEEVRYAASTLEVDKSAHLVVTGDADLFGLRICGAGDVDLEVMGDLIGVSPQDMTREELKESHRSFSVNLGSLFSGDPVEAVSSLSGTGFGSHKKHRLDVAVGEAGQSGIMPEGTLKLKVHKDAKLTDFPVEGGRGTEFSARSKCIEKQPEIHEYAESSNVMGQLLRAFTATMGLVQEVEKLADHLAPEPLQRELYQALEEEGVSPTESAQIIEDPVLQQAIKDIDEAAAEIKQVAKTQRQVEAVSAGTSSHPVSDAPVDIMDLDLDIPDVPGVAQYLAALRDPTPQQTVLQQALVKVSSGIQTVRRSAVEFGETHPRLVSALEGCADYGIQVARFGFYVGSGLAGGATGSFVMGPGPGTAVGVTLGLAKARATEEAVCRLASTAFDALGSLTASQATTPAQAAEFYSSTQMALETLATFCVLPGKGGKGKAGTTKMKAALKGGSVHTPIDIETIPLTDRKLAYKRLSEVFTPVSVEAGSLINRELLHTQLGIEQLLGEVFTEGGKAVIKGLKDAPRLVSQHGGLAADWVKKTTREVLLQDGRGIQIHWHENLKTGQKVDGKISFDEKKGKQK